jgi:hypothetical protein
MGDQLDNSQVERFKEIARMMECDDEARRDERLKNVASRKPDHAEKPSQP